MVIYGHLCYAVGKRNNERDLGCVVTPKVSFYVGITHFPSVYRGNDEIQQFNISTFASLIDSVSLIHQVSASDSFRR